MSNCIKTGCHVFLAEYGIYVRGDAFKFAIGNGTYGVFYFRLNNLSQSAQPTEDMLHFIITEIEDWFDRNAKGTSTLIAASAEYYGYEGKPIDSVIRFRDAS